MGKALSIQAHPDKELAALLHKAHPDVYRDPSHKPEMAIALTEFEMLCGFRPIEQIEEFFKDVPVLKGIGFKDLKTSFTALMNSDPSITKKHYAHLKNPKNEVDKLFLRLWDQYPGDIGCLCVYFLNYIKLKPGEAVFMAANEPHAYLKGDCLEVMACSDNVVRAGLTPKPRDVDTLCKMLTYKVHNPSDIIICPSLIYAPPVEEFAVEKLEDGSTVRPGSLVIMIHGTASLSSPLKVGVPVYVQRESRTKISDPSTLLYSAFEPSRN